MAVELEEHLHAGVDARLRLSGAEVRLKGGGTFRGRPPSVTHRPLEQSDFAGTRSGRVDVAYCSSVRAPVRKAKRLERITHQATAETLARAARPWSTRVSCML